MLHPLPPPPLESSPAKVTSAIPLKTSRAGGGGFHVDPGHSHELASTRYSGFVRKGGGGLKEEEEEDLITLYNPRPESPSFLLQYTTTCSSLSRTKEREQTIFMFSFM